MHSSKGKNAVVDEELRSAASRMSVDDDEGEWQLNTRRPKPNKPTASASASARHNPNSRGHQHQGQAGRGSLPTVSSSNDGGQRTRGGYHKYPPLQDGWNWPGRPGAQRQPQPPPSPPEEEKEESEEDDEDDFDDEDDSEEEDEYDSSKKNHDLLKQSKWFQKFFESMDRLELDEINDLKRQRHCPSCQNGPGAIDWFRGLQSLMNHAKTKAGNRVRLHRKLALLLEEELCRKGTSVVPPGETFGLWKGLENQEKDHDIVWPPMVIIMNTHLTHDDNDKWTGMGNQELLEYFSSYTPTRARHSYGPQGHRGMSLLMFEASARGFLEAERLHKRFITDGKDRDAWRSRRSLLSGGKRQLYGYLATKDDLTVFNQHSHGKAKVKYEMKSYHEMVVNQLKQMSEDNQQLGWYKDKLSQEKRHSKAVEESLDDVSQRLRQTMEENRIIRQRTRLQHEENKEEMYSQEEFFKDQILILHQTRDANEERFERLQQEEREKAKKSSAGNEALSKFIELQDKEMDDYASEREAIIKAEEEEMKAMLKRHGEEKLEREKALNAKLANLILKYNPKMHNVQ